MHTSTSVGNLKFPIKSPFGFLNCGRKLELQEGESKNSVAPSFNKIKYSTALLKLGETD